jgi:hypothetical protein
MEKWEQTLLESFPILFLCSNPIRKNRRDIIHFFKQLLHVIIKLILVDQTHCRSKTNAVQIGKIVATRVNTHLNPLHIVQFKEIANPLQSWPWIVAFLFRFSIQTLYSLLIEYHARFIQLHIFDNVSGSISNHVRVFRENIINLFRLI